MCANNYLGLSAHPEINAAAKKGIDDNGYGLSSVRFICGTQNIHLELEKKLSEFLRKDDTILFSSCFDANGGLFETILTSNDVVLSDALNHASIIDGIRLCKAKRLRYANNSMTDLRSKLEEARQFVQSSSGNKGTILVATDGVFSMDGIVCNLRGVCDLADEFGALVAVDDSHATGFMGANGRGSAEHCGVLDRVHIITSTLGKALSGGSGGFVSSSKPVIDLLRQRARPYLFSNSLPPSTVLASLKALEIVTRSPPSSGLRDRLKDNAAYFRKQMHMAGFTLSGADHPIIPVMTFDAAKATELCDALYRRGIFAVAFSFPVVPKGKARVRVQVSAAHSRYHLDRAIRAFVAAGMEVGLLEGTSSKTLNVEVSSKL